jgi:hypothetical protein
MNQCQNPECSKEIPDNLNYCNEQCLRRHIAIKKEAKFKEACPESAKILDETEKEVKSKEASAKELQKSKNNGNNKVGLRFGSGGERREANILAIKKAIISGIPDKTIIEEGELWFSREKLQMYINIAKRLIEKDSKYAYEEVKQNE